MHGLDTHTWKQPRETSRTPYITHTLRTRTGYAHMETGLKNITVTLNYLKVVSNILILIQIVLVMS